MSNNTLLSSNSTTSKLSSSNLRRPNGLLQTKSTMNWLKTQDTCISTQQSGLLSLHSFKTCAKIQNFHQPRLMDSYRSCTLLRKKSQKQKRWVQQTFSKPNVNGSRSTFKSKSKKHRSLQSQKKMWKKPKTLQSTFEFRLCSNPRWRTFSAGLVLLKP